MFVAKADDFACTAERTIIAGRKKNISIVIKPSITYADYVNAVIATLFSIGAFYVVFALALFFCSRSTYVPRAMEYVDNGESAPSPATCTEPELAENVSLSETEYDTIAEADESREIIYGKSVIYLSDLAKKDPRILKKKSYSYLWHVLTVALFYGLPVVQLVITYQKVLNDTGNQDLCYYNFLCAHPYGFFSDFNHLFSNIGYVLFGILFLCIVYKRETWHKDLVFDRVCSSA